MLNPTIRWRTSYTIAGTVMICSALFAVLVGCVRATRRL